MNEAGLKDHQPLAHFRAAPFDPNANHDTHDLAISLGPALIAHCSGRLGPIEWFRAAWQRGGAATGFSTWDLGLGQRVGVIVKFPVSPCEHRWTTALGTIRHDSWHEPASLTKPTPRVVASGLELGGYDLAWIITERLQGPTLSSHLTENAVLDLLSAAAGFQAAAMEAAPLGERPPSPPWERTLDHARENCRAGGIHDSQRWNEALKKVQKALPTLKARWDARPINAWCHGDLHPGNALRRPLSTDNGPTVNGNSGGRQMCVLIDLALVHAGHWIEDALYLERQFWGHGEPLHGVKPLTMFAKFRRDRNLPTDDQYPDIANIRRVLTAACAPALIEREGNPKYLHAALELIERTLPQVLK
jgi:hypothetical protein